MPMNHTELLKKIDGVLDVINIAHPKVYPESIHAIRTKIAELQLKAGL